MNPYDILGVSKDATDDEIRKAYKILASKLHPDKDTGDVVMMQQVNDAYAILSDPAKRNFYDSTGIIKNAAEDNEARINMLIRNMFIALLNNPAVNFDVDNVIEVMRNAVKESIRTMDNGIVSNLNVIKKREKILKRIIKKNGGHNVMTEFLLSNIEEAKKANENLSISINEYNQVMNQLENYDYDLSDMFTPPSQPVMYLNWTA